MSFVISPKSARPAIARGAPKDGAKSVPCSPQMISHGMVMTAARSPSSSPGGALYTFGKSSDKSWFGRPALCRVSAQVRISDEMPLSGRGDPVQLHDQTASYGTTTQIREHIRNRLQI